jgi:hypothetical protein
LTSTETRSYKHGTTKRQNVVTAKARIDVDDRVAIVPVLLPSVEEVRQFAQELHASGQPWEGEVFGWQAEYCPQVAEPPLDSKMTFTPAEFCIGESGVWLFSLMWEQGENEPPTEFLDRSHIVGAQ